MTARRGDARRAAVSDLLAAALPAAADRLGSLDRVPVESDLKAALRESLDGRLRGMTLEPGEHSVSLDDWPKVGAVDLAIDLPDDHPVLIELKWGRGTLYNCAWDAAKLALAVARGVTNAAFMIAGAPSSEWSGKVLGSELFADASWETSDFMDRHASGFAKWRGEVETRPAVLPARFSSRERAAHVFQVHGEPWEIRMAQISTAPVWVLVSEDGRVGPLASDD